MKVIRLTYLRMLTGPLVGCWLASGLGLGCHKSAPPTSEVLATLDTNSPSPGYTPERAKPVTPNADILQDPTVRQNLRQLNGWLNRFLATYHRIPVSFAELAAGTGGAVPAPPSGYRYVVRGPEVTLQATQ
jgi:hypothetical protein